MSNDFALDWLRLREPLDEQARAIELTWALGRALPSQPLLMDLGCGTGSNLRQLALRLGATRQEWTLIDKDRKLLTKAPGEMTRWAGRNGWAVREERRALRIEHEDLQIRAEMRSYDLAGDLTGLAFGTVDGVTANALFDLVSRTWLDRFIGELAANGYPPLLATLIVDGVVRFTPDDPDDGFVLERFHADMGRDKGFGPALGPAAPATMVDLLRRAGYRLEGGRSDWRIGPKQRAAHAALIDGYAAAAAAVDPAATDRITAWAERRRGAINEKVATLTVGHMDLLALRR